MQASLRPRARSAGGAGAGGAGAWLQRKVAALCCRTGTDHAMLCSLNAPGTRAQTRRACNAPAGHHTGTTIARICCSITSTASYSSVPVSSYAKVLHVLAQAIMLSVQPKMQHIVTHCVQSKPSCSSCSCIAAQLLLQPSLGTHAKAKTTHAMHTFKNKEQAYS